jgi:hypothetical protein
MEEVSVTGGQPMAAAPAKLTGRRGTFAPMHKVAFSSLRWGWLGLAALFYVALCGWYTWPLAQQPSSAFVGFMHRDASVFVWNVWNFRHQVLAGHSPFQTDALLYPASTSLWMHTSTPLLGALGTLLGHELLGLNLGICLSFVLSGLGAAWLAGRWVRQPLLCVLVGFVFAFSPYKLARWPEHANLLLTATVPFYIGAYLQAFDFAPGRWLPRVRSRRALLATAALGLLTLLSDYYVLAGLCYFSAGYAAWWALGLGNLNWRGWRAWLGLVLVLVVGHYLVRGLGLLGFDDHAGLYWGADLAGYVVPPLGNRYLSTAATEAFWHSPKLLNPGSVEHVVWQGYLLPLLALGLAVSLGWRCRAGLAPATPPDARPFWALALLFVALTLPELRWKGHDFWRLPNALVHYVPFLNNIRCPTRHALFVSLFLALATAIGLDGWLRRGPAARGWLVSGALLVALLVEFQVTNYPLVRTTDVPTAYRTATANPAVRVVFTIPFGVQDGYHQLGQMDAADMFYQTQHQRPLPGGYLARVPASTFAAYRHDAPLRQLLLAQTHPDSLRLLPAPTPAEQAAFRQRYAGAVFLIHPAQRQGPAHQLLRQWLLPAHYREREAEGGYLVLAAEQQ